MALVNENKSHQSSDVPIINFTGSCSALNRMIAAAFDQDALAVLILANEVEPTENSLQALLSARSQHPLAILGGRIFSAKHPNLFVHTGYWWSAAELDWCMGSYVELLADPTAPVITSADWLITTALLIPREAWLATGGFDIGFGAFLADVDWCLRARKAGFECLLVNDARFRAHKFPLFAAPTEYERLRSSLRLASKHSMPCGMGRLVIKRIVADFAHELIRVGFWTDYGSAIGMSKRVLWYLRNLALALTRDRLRSAVKDTIRAAREASLKYSTGPA